MSRGTPDWGNVAGGQQGIAELATYFSSHGQDVAPAATKYVLSLFNPSNSGVIARIMGLIVVVRFLAANADSSYSAGLLRTTSLGTGTTLTPVKADTTDDAAAVSVRSDLSVAPTLGGVISGLEYGLREVNTAQLARISSVIYQLPVYTHLPGNRGKPITLRPGEGITFRSFQDAITTRIAINIEHTEEPV